MGYKLLHLADLHLDSPLGWLGEREAREIRRSEQREALKRALSLAEERGAHAVLIAGDLFEQRNFTLDTVDFLRSTFEGCPLPILVVAGNHDPLVEGSPYITHSWPANVHIFGGDWECVEPVGGLVVHGASHSGFSESRRPLTGLKVPQDGAVHVVLLHGSYLGWRPSDPFSALPSFPLSRREMRGRGVHYFALGHYHAFRDLAEEGLPGCYPGSPEALGIEEEGERFVVLAEVDRERARIEPLAVNARKALRVEVDCSGASNREEVMERLRGKVFSKELEGQMVELVLVGEVEPEVEADPEGMEAVLREEVRREGRGPLFLRVRSRLSPRYDIEQLKKERTVRGEFVRLMLERIERAKERGDEEMSRRLWRAMLYGLDAFVRREVGRR